MGFPHPIFGAVRSVTNNQVGWNPFPAKSRLTPMDFLKALLLFGACYLVFFVVTRLAWWFLIEQAGIRITRLPPRDWPEYIAVFVLFFWPLLYLACSFAAGKFLAIDFPKAAMYMGCTFFGAMWFEVILDSLFVKFCGQPGWLYKVWPIHHGYTSGVGMLMWPLYGFFVYGMRLAIKNNPKLAKRYNAAAMTFLFALDAMALEILTNIFSILLYHTYLFYYLPGDLLHFTTIQIFVPYLFACGLGALFSGFFERVKRHQCFIGVSFYLAGVGSLLFVVS
ncbi:MAG TPA: hypothetical protein PLT45_06970 [Smithella sp.]|nr:hypothetical protein [Smithella sp.]